MKHFIKENGVIYGYEDNQLHLVTEDMRELDAIEFEARTSQQPSQFHVWDEDNLKWIDPRADEEIAAYNRSLLPTLTKRQFALYLYDGNQYEAVMSAINANPRFRIEYDSVSDIERLSQTVTAMTTLLNLTDEQVDDMWHQALTL